MKRDRELMQRVQDAQQVALKARDAMAEEARKLRLKRDKLSDGIKEFLIAQMDRKASDLEGYRALDVELGGMLGIDAFVRETRDRHREAIRRQRVMENLRSLETQIEPTLETRDPTGLEIADLEREEASLKKKLDSFDPEFLAVKKLIDDLPEGASNKHLRSPPLMANLLDPMLVQASRRLKRYEASSGRSFDKMLGEVYLPAVERLEFVRARLSSARRLERLAYGRLDYRDRVKAAEREIEELNVEHEVVMRGKDIDNIVPGSRKIAIEAMMLTIESFDRRFRSAGAPVSTDDLDAMAKVGLIDHGALKLVMLRAGIGMVLDVVDGRIRHHDQTLGSLGEYVREARDVDDETIFARYETIARDLLDRGASDAERRSRVDESVMAESRRVLTGEGPRIPDGSGMELAQKATILWATAGTFRARQALSNEHREEVGADQRQDIVPPPM